MIADFVVVHSCCHCRKNIWNQYRGCNERMRSWAKTANFGIIYGISAFGLSERLNIGRKEAKDLIDGYFASYPGVRKYG